MIRLAFRILLAFIALIVCLTGYFITKPFGRSDAWVQRFLGLAASAFGARVRIEGQPLLHDVLFAANHLSWLDILALGGATGTAFVAKDAIRAWPVVGWLATIGGTIYIDRGSRTAARGQADALGSALITGRPAAFFPEGTTGNGITLSPFRATLFAAVTPPPPGVRVQPVAIDYGAATPDIVWPDEESPAHNAKRLISRRGKLPMTLRFLPPIDPAACADRKAMSAAVNAAIAGALSHERGLG